MEEEEWLTCTDPGRMLEWLRGPSARKLRLFACACCRRIWHLGTAEARHAVEVAERHADGQGLAGELEAAAEVVRSVRPQCFYFAAAPDGTAYLAAHAAQRATDAAADHHPFKSKTPVVWRRAHAAECEAQAELLRDLFGNPFRPVALDPAWRTPTVLAIARAIYEGRGFGDLPILADALEDAGCTVAANLDHCRRPGPHARGCWALDLLLGRE
jgi:hypothetical protein